MDKEDYNNLLSILKEYSMSIEKFLGRYYGIYFDIKGKRIIKLSHDDICSIVDNLDIVNINSLNMNDIYKGNILVVIDYKDNIRLYRKPLIIENNSTIEINNIVKKIDLVYDPESTRTRHLVYLKDCLKKNGQFNDMKKIKKIIRKRRGIENDKYKRK